MEKVYNWGIIGCGNIAKKFATAVSGLPNAKIYAAASRSLEKAKAFANEQGIEIYYGSYEELANDKNIDAIYVATTHNFHYDCMKIALNGTKPVLCEKSFTVNYKQAKELAEIAKKENLLLMEGMWTKCLPIYRTVNDWLKQIGDIRMVKADFGFSFNFNPEHRLINPQLAGGALLDVGVYVIAFATMFLGTQPKSIVSNAHIGETGVDEQGCAIMQFDNGAIANLSFAVRTKLKDYGMIYGTNGHIEVENFFGATKATLYLDGREPQTVEMPHLINGFEYEIMEFMKCLDEGKKQSDIIPLSDTLNIMKIMDTMRIQWGLVYPFESKENL